MDNYPKVGIVILNWNGWRDTIECLESVFRNDYPNYEVIVCDNASSDQSLGHIKSWAEDRLLAEPQSHDERITRLVTPPVATPIPYVEYNRTEAEKGGFIIEGQARLILIQTGANLGFAGGNNVGLRYALARGDFDYVWLLNNDTVIKPDALTHMVHRMEERPDAGMCGSTIPYYRSPDTVWCLGGAIYNKWISSTKCIGLNGPIPKTIDRDNVEKRMAYVAGASILVSKRFVEDIGLMCEDYFLYYEEIDWAIRGREVYNIVYAPKSIVYHKVGTSIDSAKNNAVNISEHYALKNHIIFTRKFFPAYLPLAYVRVAVRKMKTKMKVLLNRK